MLLALFFCTLTAASNSRHVISRERRMCADHPKKTCIECGLEFMEEGKNSRPWSLIERQTEQPSIRAGSYLHFRYIVMGSEFIGWPLCRALCRTLPRPCRPLNLTVATDTQALFIECLTALLKCLWMVTMASIAPWQLSVVLAKTEVTVGRLGLMASNCEKRVEIFSTVNSFLCLSIPLTYWTTLGPLCNPAAWGYWTPVIHLSGFYTLAVVLCFCSVTGEVSEALCRLHLLGLSFSLTFIKLSQFQRTCSVHPNFRWSSKCYYSHCMKSSLVMRSWVTLLTVEIKILSVSSTVLIQPAEGGIYFFMVIGCTLDAMVSSGMTQLNSLLSSGMTQLNSLSSSDMLLHLRAPFHSGVHKCGEVTPVFLFNRLLQ